MQGKPNWRGTMQTDPDMLETRIRRVERIVPNVWRNQPTHTRSRYDVLKRATITQVVAAVDTKVSADQLAPVAFTGDAAQLTGSLDAGNITGTLDTSVITSSLGYTPLPSNVQSLPEYADNTAASAHLSAGEIYRKPTGEMCTVY